MPVRRHSQKVQQTGFTLVEVLIAMAVFALISVTVYSGLSQTTLMRGVLLERYDRLAELQRVIAYVERDLLQVVARPAKSPFGDLEPALLLIDARDVIFTRTGGERDFIQTEPQSSLLRLQYVAQDDKLLRVVYSVLDRAQDSPVYPNELISGLARFQVQAFHNNRWHDEWPLVSSDRDTPDPLALLPRVLQISIESEDGYTLSRTIVLHESMGTST